MSIDDRLPLADTPSTDRIRERADNRLGAVYSALYSFWSARHAAVSSGQVEETTGARRDAYSVIMFNSLTRKVVTNDFTSSPDELLDVVLSTAAEGGTNFAAALRAGQAVMEENWDIDRFENLTLLSGYYCESDLPYIPQNTYHDIPLRWRMSDPKYGYARSVSLRNSARVGSSLPANLPTGH